MSSLVSSSPDLSVSPYYPHFSDYDEILSLPSRESSLSLFERVQNVYHQGIRNTHAIMSFIGGSLADCLHISLITGTVYFFSGPVMATIAAISTTTCVVFSNLEAFSQSSAVREYSLRKRISLFVAAALVPSVASLSIVSSKTICECSKQYFNTSPQDQMSYLGYSFMLGCSLVGFLMYTSKKIISRVKLAFSEETIKTALFLGPLTGGIVAGHHFILNGFNQKAVLSSCASADVLTKHECSLSLILGPGVWAPLCTASYIHRLGNSIGFLIGRLKPIQRAVGISCVLVETVKSCFRKCYFWR
jgi:hypothetical protein